MKKEIKFRAWDGVDYMTIPFTLHDIMEYEIQFASDAIIMQYTGIKDKNGHEIYEGDLVYWDYPEDAIVVEIGWMEVDAFEVMGCNVWNFYDRPLGVRLQKEITKLGNIYENPELIPTEEK